MTWGKIIRAAHRIQRESYAKLRKDAYRDRMFYRTHGSDWRWYSR